MLLRVLQRLAQRLDLLRLLGLDVGRQQQLNSAKVEQNSISEVIQKNNQYLDEAAASAGFRNGRRGLPRLIGKINDLGLNFIQREDRGVCDSKWGPSPKTPSTSSPPRWRLLGSPRASRRSRRP